MRRKKMVILPKLHAPAGDKWFVYFSVRNPHTDDMVRFKRSGKLNSIKGKKARQEEAERLLEEYRQQLKAGWTPYVEDEQVIYADSLQYQALSDIYTKKRKSNRTLNYYSNEFLKHIKDELKPASLRTYRSKIRAFNAWVDAKGEGDNDISAVSNNHVLEFFRFLIDERKLSGNSITKYRLILMSLFEYVVTMEGLRMNPVYNVPKCNRINDNAARAVYKEDVERFKQVISKEDPQLWMAIEFEYYCYIRPGTELRLLKIDDIDFARGLIFIDRENFKRGRENVKEIPRHFLKKIREVYRLHTYPRDYYVFGKNRVPDPEYVGKNTLRTRFNKFRDAMDMPKEYKFYGWKHTGGVTASESGIPIKDISDQMGHTNISTTSGYIKAKGGTRIDSIRENYPEL